MTTLLAAIMRPILVGYPLVGYTDSLCHPHVHISSESKQESHSLALLKMSIITIFQPFYVTYAAYLSIKESTNVIKVLSSIPI